LETFFAFFQKMLHLGHYCVIIRTLKGGENIMSNELSQKIKDLRIKNGMTLEQVGDIVGVGKSTVRKWETGMIANMKRDKIALLAKALGTTPAYLMGWKDDNKTNAPDIKTEGEKKWMELYHQLSNETREMLITSLSSFDKLSADQQQLALEVIRVALRNKK
jgi:transcriptional regulator with XRE-family HTH domain